MILVSGQNRNALMSRMQWFVDGRYRYMSKCNGSGASESHACFQNRPPPVQAASSLVDGLPPIIIFCRRAAGLESHLALQKDAETRECSFPSFAMPGQIPY